MRISPSMLIAGSAPAASDALVVHLAGAEAVTGAKTFSAPGTALSVTNNAVVGGVIAPGSVQSNVYRDSAGDAVSTLSLNNVGTGINGNAPVAKAAAIAAANAQTGAYVQADVQSIATAVNAIRAALTALGVTS